MVMAPSAIAIDQPSTTTLTENKIGKIDCPNTNHGVESNVTGFASRALTQKVLKEQIARIDVDTCEPGEEDAFYVADLGEVYRQHLRWKMNLSRVKPFYGEFHMPFIFCVWELIVSQRSNATRIKKCFAFWPNWAPVSIVRLGLRSTWFSALAFRLAVSSMPNHARQSPTSDMLEKSASIL